MNAGGKRNLIRAAVQLARVPRYSPLRLMDENRGVIGCNMGTLLGEIPLITEEVQALLALYEAGRIEPHVGSSYPFERAADAHAELEYGKNRGKVLLTP